MVSPTLGWDREIAYTQDAIRALGPWGQNVRLPNGVETAPERGGSDQETARLLLEGLPEVQGLRVLDVGCGAGLYAFTLARQGASVVAVDEQVRCVAQARWLRKRLAPRQDLRFRRLPLVALDRVPGTFDVVLMMDTLSRARHPSLVLELAANKCRGLAVVGPTSSQGPPTILLESHGGLRWQPNRAAVELLLRAVGFEPRKGRSPLTVADAVIAPLPARQS